MPFPARYLSHAAAALSSRPVGNGSQRWYTDGACARCRRSASTVFSGVRSRIAHFMRLLLVALLVGSLLQIAQVPVAAAPAEQTPSAQMTVRAGYDGLGKANGWLPIEVEIRNDGPDIDGEIQIVIS